MSGDEKDWYIHEISKRSDRYGGKLLELMDMYNAANLQEVTLEQAQEFYELLKGGKKKWQN